ncbi:hypothetical protein BH11PSE3_BH11PSE3_40830 [soil metagenome]
MALNLSILPDAELCLVTGDGTVTRADIEGYLAHSLKAGAKNYAKLVDLTGATLILDPDDLEIVAQGLVRYSMGERPGPVALVVGNAITLDMAVLLKQRVGERPFRIFTSIDSARVWIVSYREISRPEIVPTGIRLHDHGLPAK